MRRDRTRVIVLGAGDAGLMAAMRLAKKRMRAWPSRFSTLPTRSRSGCAEDHIAANRPRCRVSPEKHRCLLEEFVRAGRSGELDAWTTLLVNDAIVWTDGGGKVPSATLQPEQGGANESRLIGVTARFAPPDAQLAVANVNGKPTRLVRHAHGTPFLVVSIGLDQGRIIWIIANPDQPGAVGS